MGKSMSLESKQGMPARALAGPGGGAAELEGAAPAGIPLQPARAARAATAAPGRQADTEREREAIVHELDAIRAHLQLWEDLVGVEPDKFVTLSTTSISLFAGDLQSRLAAVASRVDSL